MLTTIYALLLRAASCLALGFVLFLWVWPLKLYAEGIWLPGIEDLVCFLVVSGVLSAPLVYAAASGWRAAWRCGQALPPS